MEIGLSILEKNVIKNILKKKQSNLIPFLFSFLAGAILLISPFIFVIGNLPNIDQIIKTTGIYLGIMAGLGLSIILYSTYAMQANKQSRILYSTINKIVTAYGINLS